MRHLVAMFIIVTGLAMSWAVGVATDFHLWSALLAGPWMGTQIALALLIGIGELRIDF